MPNIWGGLGIGTICIGSYILNINFATWSPLSPLMAVFKETGSWLMLIVSILFSFTSVIGKVIILHSSIMFFSIFFFMAFNLFLIIALLTGRKIVLKSFMKDPVKGAVAGILFFSHVVFHGFAIAITKAVYMISVKRLSVLFSIIYGGMLFKEKNLIIRFCGTLLMFIGAIFILLKGAP